MWRFCYEQREGRRLDMRSEASVVTAICICGGSQASMHAQSCLNVWDSMDCNTPGDFPGKKTGCHLLLQGIFETQGSNPSLLCFLHCRGIPYHWGPWEASVFVEKAKETQRLEGQDHSAQWEVAKDRSQCYGCRSWKEVGRRWFQTFVLQIGNKDADTDKDAVKETDAERLAPGHPVSQWLTEPEATPL